MRIATSADYESIISALAGRVPENNPGMQGLYELLADSRVQLQPYSFVLLFANMTAATVAPAQSFIVDTSAPFMLISQQYFADDYPITGGQTAATQNVPNATVQIVDQQSNRNWQSAAVPVPSIFGSAERPYFYPQPRMIAANSNVQVTVANIDAASVYSIYLVFTGYRYYSSGSQ